MPKTDIVLSCEHASNKIPTRYLKFFKNLRKDLSTHKAYDIGAKNTAAILSQKLKSPLFNGTVSRLLIDLNRSIQNPALFHKSLRPRLKDQQRFILKKYYLPHRNLIEKTIRQKIKNGKLVLHFAIHSFTPSLNGKKRDTEVGLLFDPRRRLEKQTCQTIKINIKRLSPQLKLHFNRPYKGTSDGLTKFLRTKFTDKDYAGIEVEINQSFFQENSKRKKQRMALIFNLAQALKLHLTGV